MKRKVKLTITESRCRSGFHRKGEEYIKLTLIMDEISKKVDLRGKNTAILDGILNDFDSFKYYCLRLLSMTDEHFCSCMELPPPINDESEGIGSSSQLPYIPESVDIISQSPKNSSIRLPFLSANRYETDKYMQGSESGKSSDSSPNSSSLASSDR